MSITKFKVPINVLFALLGGAVSFFVFSNFSPFHFQNQEDGTSASESSTKTTKTTTVSNHLDASCGYRLIRGVNGGYVNPLLMVDPDCEDAEYLELKTKIQSYIEENISSGRLISASAYVRDLANAGWIDCNAGLKYHPGSLAKVPMLLAYLKKAQTEPNTLSKVLHYDHIAEGHVHHQTFNSKQIELGHDYTVRQLLDYMIGYSDNAATFMLNMNMGMPPYLKVFADLGIHAPSGTDRNYEMTTKEYSRFFIVLYNGTYLTQEMSQTACTILNNGEFNDGILKAIPKTVSTIHKFGESGNNSLQVHELHECAVVFLGNTPYLLTVMTKGKDNTILPGIISHISELTYKHMKGRAKAA